MSKRLIPQLIAFVFVGLAFLGRPLINDTVRVRVTNHPSIGQFWQVQEGRLVREITREPIIDDLDDLLLGAPRDEYIYISAPRWVEQVGLIQMNRGQVVDRRKQTVERADEPPRGPTPEPMLRSYTASNLPAKYNFCDDGECVIKDQGTCGACWAFGTNTPIQALAGQDVSEQYLVDCNTHDWGCRGGFWAFDYWTEYPPNDLGPGQILELDAPYRGVDQTCNPPYPRQDTIGGSVEVANDIAAIKEALLANGPVATSMCTNWGFSIWRAGDGVFTREYGCGLLEPSNHAVVIVGWDDALNAWRVQNSWGEQWCDNGFIWMEYGASGVGRDAIQPRIDESIPEPEPPSTITVRIEPALLTLNGYGSVRTDIIGESMTHVSGWQVRLWFDPDVVTPDLNTFEFGDFMSEPGYLKLGPVVDLNAGWLLFGKADISRGETSGDGTLGSVSWIAKSDGETELDFGLGKHSPTVFLTRSIEPIPLTSIPGRVVAYTGPQCQADYAPPWGEVDLFDVTTLVDHWHAKCGDGLYREDMDWNDDCVIDEDDVQYMLERWQEGCHDTP